MNKIFKIVLLIGCLSAIQTSWAKEITIDTLYKQIEKTKVDTTKVNLYLQLSTLYHHQELDSFCKYAQQALDLSEKILWKSGISKSASKLATYYSLIGEQDQVLRLSLKVIENNPAPFDFMVAAQTISSIYLGNQQFDKAFEYAQMIIDKKDLADVYKAMGFTTKADIFRIMNQVDSARYYFESAINLLKDPKTEHEISIKISALIQYSVMQEDPARSYAINLEMKDLYEKMTPNPRLYSLIQHSYASSILALLETDTLDPSIGKTRKELFAEEEDLLSHLDEISQTPGYEALKLETARKLHQFYALKKDYGKAYSWVLKYHDLENEMFSQENKNKLASVENEKLTERYEHEVQMKQLEIDSKKKQQRLYTVAISLLVIITALLIYYNIHRKNTNKKLAELNKNLAEANEVKIKLFSIINHDLRKPIARLIGYLKFKEEDPQSLNAEDRMQIEQQTLGMSENLLQLMEELLIWSKSQMSQFTQHYEQTPLSSLFEEINQLATGNTSMEINLPPNMQLYTDPYYLKTIIRNLTSNAVQAAQTSPAPLVKWNVESDQDQVYLKVANNGKSMNEKQKEILLHGANSNNISQGLGLQIIHDLVKNINCEIAIDNTTQDETTITLILKKADSNTKKK